MCVKMRVGAGCSRRLAACLVVAIGADCLAQQTPVNFKIAFFGDQSLDEEAVAVLTLIKDEGADAVVHSGDFDYEDDPAAWDAMINSVLGSMFPYFACAGNHDDGVYYGLGGYQQVLEQRMNRLGVSWEGDLGVRSSFHYQGIQFVLTAPDIFGDDGDTVFAPYVRSTLASSKMAWRISGWHVLMEAMQVGGKSDQSGWGVYEESRRGGAIIATAHEHSYARTHTLRSFPEQIVDISGSYSIRADDPATHEDEGVTFAFHSGLGGHSIRDQERCFPATPPHGCNEEWASIYTSDQGANYGALFGVFNYQGDRCQAYFYFKDIDGTVPDEFFVRSWVGTCRQCVADLTADEIVDESDMIDLINSWGTCAGSCPADFDGDGTVGIRDLLILLWEWGVCQAPP